MSDKKVKSSKKPSSPAAGACAAASDWLPEMPCKKNSPVIQTGVATVGPNKLTETLVPPCGQGVVKVTISFPFAFRSVPVVTVTALDQSGLSPTAQDTFAVSLAGVSPAGFTAKVWRVDHPGGETGFSAARESLAQTSWAQILRLSWIAVAAGRP